MSTKLKIGQGQSANIGAQQYAIQLSELYLSKDLRQTVNNIIKARHGINIEVHDPEVDQNTTSLDSMMAAEGAMDFGEMYSQSNEALGYKMRGDGMNYRPDISEDRNKFFSSKETIIDEIKASISYLKCPASYKEIGVFLADCLDQNGFIAKPEVAYKAYQKHFQAERGELILIDDIKLVHQFMIQNLEPAGVMTRDVFESLEQKITRDPSWSSFQDLSLQLLTVHQNDLRNCAKIDKHGKVIFDEAALSSLPLFKNLSGDNLASNVVKYINNHNKEIFPGWEPAAKINTSKGIDFLVTLVDNEYHVQKLGIPETTINEAYIKQWAAFAKVDKSVLKLIENDYKIKADVDKMLTSVKDVSEMVVKEILDVQRKVVETGDYNLLQVLRNVDLAEKFKIEQSVVSSIVQSKIVLRDVDNITVKHLMDRGIEFNGMGEKEFISKVHLKDFIKDKVRDEDIEQPVSDQEFRSMFMQSGYKISVDMVKRLREDINLPDANGRTEFYKNNPGVSFFDSEPAAYTEKVKEKEEEL